MVQAAVNLYERAEPEVLKVAALDREHLARMTFGDRSLEREVLQPDRLALASQSNRACGPPSGGPHVFYERFSHHSCTGC